MKKNMLFIVALLAASVVQASDKWDNQCAFTPKAIQAFDATGTAPTAKIERGAYYVTQTNKSMVGISVETGNYDSVIQAPEMKFKGWVKKSDMQIVPYRNCSF